jgi:signal transduction histidine kinase
VLRSPRWSAEATTRWLRLLLWPAAAVVGIAAEASLYGWVEPRNWVPDLLTGWTLIACGLVGWWRRPASRSGVLLAAAGFAWFAPNFATTGIGALNWLAAHALYLHRGPLVALVLTYPRGRPVRRTETVALAVGFAAALVTPVWRSETATIVLAVLLIVVAMRGYLGTVGAERRMRIAALQATTALAAILLATAIVRLAVSTPAATTATLHGYQAGLCVLSLGLVVGLFRAAWERAQVTDLVVELGETRAATLRDALARALGDPSLQVGYWFAEADGFVDAEGRSLALPEAEQSVTMVERDGLPLAVLVHDPAVLNDPGLLEAVASAAKLAATNARLQGEVRARLAELRASRQRIVEAGDEERERLERRLRDGAQQRLDELAETLREASRSAIGEITVNRIAQSVKQLSRGQEELGRFARGIHPRELSEHGLVAALTSLAEEFQLPVELSVPVIDVAPSVAACVYFVCSEALANVAKHAAASAVRISLRASEAAMTVEIADDGVGGADASHGSGLRGLADRVETLGGTLTVQSPPGAGTRLIAVIPEPDSTI